MGLFSSSSKNKQDSASYSRADDDNIGAVARSKRAGNAGKSAADPLLPEKKRARRRLVGAIALALAVAVGLPMILDSEPKQLATDIAIQIPSKDKAAPLAAPAKLATPDGLDAKEEIVDPAKLSAAKPETPAPAPAAAVAKPAVPEAAKPADTAAKPSDTKHADTAAAKPAETAKHAEPVAKDPKPIAEVELKSAKPSAKVEDKKAQIAADDARALAILEGKGTEKPAEAIAHKIVIQIGSFKDTDKINEVQGKLSQAGIKSFTEKIPSNGLTRIRVGPFASKEEADKTMAKLKSVGLSGTLMSS